jgi:hypothetical protein
MFQALGTCQNVQDFENLLDSTNVTGRRTASNFAVIDRDGSAAIYETGGDQYWKYDATDTSQAPNGYMLRTNFSFTGGGDAGIERFNRTVNLISDFYAGDTLNYKSVLRTQMRDFSDQNSSPINVPYTSQWDPEIPFGYISTEFSICREPSISAVVIQGVLPDEPAELSTMWTLLGQPAVSIAIPYWSVGDIPVAADDNPTAPLCDIANQIRGLLFDLPESEYINTFRLRDENTDGLWNRTFTAEDSIFHITDSLQNQWRSGAVDISKMIATESDCANFALRVMNDCYDYLVSQASIELAYTSPLDYELSQNFPNPFNSSTKINYQLPITNDVDLGIYNLLGQRITTLVNNRQQAGHHQVEWDAGGFASGLYYYRIEAGNFVQTRKMIYLK